MFAHSGVFWISGQFAVFREFSGALSTALHDPPAAPCCNINALSQQAECRQDILRVGTSLVGWICAEGRRLTGLGKYQGFPGLFRGSIGTFSSNWSPRQISFIKICLKNPKQNNISSGEKIVFYLKTFFLWISCIDLAQSSRKTRKTLIFRGDFPGPIKPRDWKFFRKI